MKLTKNEQKTINQVRELADNLDEAKDDLDDLRDLWSDMDDVEDLVINLDEDKFSDVKLAFEDIKDFIGKIPFPDDCNIRELSDALDDLDNDEEDEDE